MGLDALGGGELPSRLQPTSSCSDWGLDILGHLLRWFDHCGGPRFCKLDLFQVHAQASWQVFLGSGVLLAGQYLPWGPVCCDII